MAMENLFSTLKKQTASVTDKLKDGISETAAKTGLYDANKQKIKPLITEKAKMYEFIGMEIFGMYTEGKIKEEAIEPFCKKIELLNAEIAKLEGDIIQAGIICECGEKLQSGVKFCSVCGRSTPVRAEGADNSIICGCGAVLPVEAKFCTICGQRIAQTAAHPLLIECVCGAMVEPSTPMCMECGRRVAVSV